MRRGEVLPTCPRWELAIYMRYPFLIESLVERTPSHLQRLYADVKRRCCLGLTAWSVTVLGKETGTHFDDCVGQVDRAQGISMVISDQEVVRTESVL